MLPIFSAVKANRKKRSKAKNNPNRSTGKSVSYRSKKIFSKKNCWADNCSRTSHHDWKRTSRNQHEPAVYLAFDSSIRVCIISPKKPRSWTVSWCAWLMSSTWTKPTTESTVCGNGCRKTRSTRTTSYGFAVFTGWWVWKRSVPNRTPRNHHQGIRSIRTYSGICR